MKRVVKECVQTILISLVLNLEERMLGVGGGEIKGNAKLGERMERFTRQQLAPPLRVC